MTVRFRLFARVLALGLLLGLLAGPAGAANASNPAALPTFDLTLKEAERRTLSTSNELQAYSATRLGTAEQADAQYAALLPRLTLDARYSYVTEIPSIVLPIPGITGGIVFGTHNNYAIGPTLSYTLWDTGAARDSYHGLSLLADAREQDERSARLQIRLSVRSAYLRVQLALQELSLLNDSLKLSRAQNHDIEANYRAGAATRLDRVDSQRDVLSYELQYEQKQNEVASDLQDLLALTQETLPRSAARPGLPGLPNTRIELHLDSLEQSLHDTSVWNFSPPDESHPQLRSAELVAQSSERGADSVKAALYPTVQFSANASYEYPNVVVPEHTEQNTFGVTISMPLFEGNRTRHLAAEKLKEAETARFNKQQTRINLLRDYQKALDLVESLRAQTRLAAEDVEHSADAARLYYQSYRGGKNTLIDVQSANNRALTSKVNATRIDAQLLNQIYQLRALSGEKAENDK